MAKFNTKFEIEGVDKLSAPFKNVAEANKELSKSFSDQKKSLRDYQQKLNRIDAYEKNVVALDKLKSQYTESSKALKSFAKEYEKAEEPTKEMREKLAELTKQTDLLKESKERSASKLRTHTKRLRDSGLDLNNLKSETIKYREEEKKLSGQLEITKKNLDVVSAAHNKVEKARRKKERIEQSANAMTNVGNEMRNKGFSILRYAINPINEAKEFEHKMSIVSAKVQGAIRGSDAFKNLEKISLDLGGETAFDPGEVAEAIALLGAAGVEAKDISKEMVSGLLDTAKANDIGLAQATDISTGMARGFGLNVKDQLGYVGDVITAITGISSATASDVQMTMKTIGPIAKVGKISMEQVAGMTSVLANAGIKGTESATALKNTILSLTTASTKGGQALKKLGVEAVDEEGKIKPLAQTFEELALAMENEGYTDDQIVKTLKDITGVEALAGFSELVMSAKTKEGMEALKKIEKEMSGSFKNIAKERAKIMSNDLEGDTVTLNSALMELNITLGKMFAPILRPLTQGLTSIVQGITSFSKENPVLSRTILGVVAGFGGLVGVAGSLMTTIAAAKLSFAAVNFGLVAMGANAATVSTGIGLFARKFVLSMFTIKGALISSGIGIALVALGFGLQKLWENWDEVGDWMIEKFEKIKEVLQPIGKWFSEIVDSMNIFGKNSWLTKKLGISVDHTGTVDRNNTSPDPIAGSIKETINTYKPASIADSVPVHDITKSILNAEVNINVAGDGDPSKIAGQVRREFNNLVENLNRKHAARMSD